MTNDKPQVKSRTSGNTDDTLPARKDSWHSPTLTKIDAAPDTRWEGGPTTDGYDGSLIF